MNRNAKLQRISEHVWILPFNSPKDRPNLGYIAGAEKAMAVDAGHSSSHVADFYDAIRAEGLSLPEITVITHWHWDHTFGMHAVNGETMARPETNVRLTEIQAQMRSDPDRKRQFLAGDPTIRREYAGGVPLKVVTADKIVTQDQTIDLGGNVQLYDCFLQTNYVWDKGPVSFTIPAHGTKIFRAKGKKRLERTRYEAETAWLSQYQELRNNEQSVTAIYGASQEASGGYIARFLGKRAENDLWWKDVNMKKAGRRTMTIALFSGEERELNVEVNGKFVKTIRVPAREWNVRQTIDVPVDFDKGKNVVRLYNAQNWMPDVDGMEIK